MNVEYERGYNRAKKDFKKKINEKIKEYEELVKDFEEYWSKDPRRFKRQQSTDYYKLEALKEILEEE
jgi:hypothetical protein